MTVSDGTESAVPSAPATASAPAAEDPTTNLNEVAAEDAGQGEAPPAEEFEDLEFDGKVWSIPKPLKSGFMFQKDYTQKTQAVAERGRELEGRQAQLDQYASLTVAEQKAIGQLGLIDDRITALIGDTPLDQVKFIDWDSWRLRDRAAADRAKPLLDGLIRARQYLEAKVRDHNAQRTQRQEQATANRLKDTRVYAEKNITGWNDDLDKQITGFALNELGYEPAELAGAMTPKLYRTLHQAWVAHTANTKPQAQNGTDTGGAKPLQVVGSRSAPGAKRSLAELARSNDASGYIEARRKQNTG